MDFNEIESYINQNYIDPDSPEGKVAKAFEQKNDFISNVTAFVRKVSGRGGFNPFTTGLGTEKRNPLEELEKKLRSNKKFSEKLRYYLNLKGKLEKQPEVYKAAGVNSDCFWKIINDKNKTPALKETIVSLAFALELNLEEATDLLAAGGYALSQFIISDVIYSYFFENGPYSIDDVNQVLVHFKCKPIGGVK